jgi:hypothetical protein
MCAPTSTTVIPGRIMRRHQATEIGSFRRISISICQRVVHHHPSNRRSGKRIPCSRAKAGTSTPVEARIKRAFHPSGFLCTSLQASAQVTTTSPAVDAQQQTNLEEPFGLRTAYEPPGSGSLQTRGFVLRLRLRCLQEIQFGGPLLALDTRRQDSQPERTRPPSIRPRPGQRVPPVFASAATGLPGGMPPKPSAVLRVRDRSLPVRK